jgi:hypothetical protein
MEFWSKELLRLVLKNTITLKICISDTSLFILLLKGGKNLSKGRTII